jgi:hypothetical protein
VHPEGNVKENGRVAPLEHVVRPEGQSQENRKEASGTLGAPSAS